MNQNPFSLTRPCSNCPFLKDGAIKLRPGRLEGIVDHLLSSDFNSFPCHKSVHSKSGGEWDNEGNYTYSGNEKMCAGAAAFLMKAGRPTVAMRFAFITGESTPDVYNDIKELIIEPMSPGAEEKHQKGIVNSIAKNESKNNDES